MRELLARLIDQWTGLTFREKILTGSAGGVTIIAILIVGVIQPVVSMASNIEARVDAAEQELVAMNRLRRQFDIVNASLTKVEERIQANREKRNLLTLLESLASSSSV